MNSSKHGVLKEKALWVRKETMKIHAIAPETRIASSLSCVEILTVLFYGGYIRFDAKRPDWEGRDRFLISKAHGSISFYPILADLGFIDKSELAKVCFEGAQLPGIPDMLVPGYETINGSLGHGAGVGCGMALALKQKKSSSKVFVLLGDGELYEGSIWEAVMFAGHHKIDNLIMIVDANRACMLDFCVNIIDMGALKEKFSVFGWEAHKADGHDVEAFSRVMDKAVSSSSGKPQIIIADTVKGKGIPSLETDPLSHIRTVKKEDIEKILETLK